MKLRLFRSLSKDRFDDAELGEQTIAERAMMNSPKYSRSEFGRDLKHQSLD